MSNPLSPRRCVEVCVIFTPGGAERVKRVLQEKYNQDDSVSLDTLCWMALMREACPSKVSPIGLDVHKS